MPDIVDPAAGCNVPGCLASLTDKGRGPGVVVIQDDLGLTSDLKRITDRFTANGYLAMAPALYGGHGPKVACMISVIRSHFTGRGAAYTDLRAAREYLISAGRCTSPWAWPASAWAPGSACNWPQPDYSTPPRPATRCFPKTSTNFDSHVRSWQVSRQ